MLFCTLRSYLATLHHICTTFNSTVLALQQLLAIILHKNIELPKYACMHSSKTILLGLLSMVQFRQKIKILYYTI